MLAETLMRNSPEIAALLIGCTPLAPFSIVLSSVAGNMVNKRLDEKPRAEHEIKDISEQITKLMKEIEILKEQK